MQTKQIILICDDQPIIHETLGAYLADNGFNYVSAFDGEQALARIRESQPDLVILDLMMPKKNGIDVCREVRKESSVPIIMLTAKGEEIDKILGLELGADDYIVKPFSPREVVARVKAVLRRLSEQRESGDDIKTLYFEGLEISLTQYEVLCMGKPLAFTPKEVEVLYMLACNSGQVFNREQILSKVWGYDFFGDTRVVDTQIKRIRQKLPSEGVPWGIKSIYGVGYKFEVKK